MNLLDTMLNIADTLAGGDDFWAGFWFCVEAVLILWGVGLIFGQLDKRWKKVRQYFEPSKKPSKPKEDPSPSPAEQSLNCLGNILTVGLLLLIAVLVLLELFTPVLTPW